MHRGFKTYRHWLNYSLHALSAVICGDDKVIDEMLEQNHYKSVCDLPLDVARSWYKQLKEVAKQVAPKHDKLKETIGLGKMSDGQRKLIIKLTKYTFNWSDEAAFSYLAEMFPDYRKRLSLWEIENSKINKLMALLTTKDADKVIKRLLQLQKRNASTGSATSEDIK